jgi:hypothetical protein
MTSFNQIKGESLANPFTFQGAIQTAGTLKFDLLEQAKKRFANEGIQIQNSHTTLILYRDFRPDEI